MQEVTSRIDREINDQLKVYAALRKIPLGRLTNQILRDWLDSQPLVTVQPTQKHACLRGEGFLPQHAHLISAGWEK